MIVCVCHAFSDKKIRQYLDSVQGNGRIAEVYSACSGGEKPQCCSCLATIKDIVRSHKKSSVVNAA